MNDCKILTDYLNYKSSLNSSTATIKEYQYDLVNFLKYVKRIKKSNTNIIDSKFLNKISLNDIYSYIAYLKEELGDSATTRARKIASIKSFFKYLYKLKIITDNPADYIEMPKLGKRLPKYLTLEQCMFLLNQIKRKKIIGCKHDNKARDYAMITLFLNCGLRLSELVNIDINNMRLCDANLTVIGKGNKERTVYLNKACIKAIKDYLKVRPDSLIDRNALFLSERKKRISRRQVQFIVKSYLETVPGLDNKYSTHKLRHTAATLMYQYGNVDIRTLQELLGHENLSTTEIYVHVNNEKARLAVESNPLANYL